MRIWLKGGRKALERAAWALKEEAAEAHMDARRSKEDSAENRQCADEIDAMAEDIRKTLYREEEGK